MPWSVTSARHFGGRLEPFVTLSGDPKGSGHFCRFLHLRIRCRADCRIIHVGCSLAQSFTLPDHFDLLAPCLHLSIQVNQREFL